MTIQEIIDKWYQERSRIIKEMEFCDKHNFMHEKEYLNQRYEALSGILYDLKFNMED